MPFDKTSVENLIHEYLLDEGVLKEKLTSDKFDFGFIISFPPGPKSQIQLKRIRKINFLMF